VLRAAFRLEALLEYFPDQVGESREGTERVILEPPLTVYYEIDHEAEIVHVRRLLAPHPGDSDSDE